MAPVYVVVEIQTAANGTVSTLVNSYADLNAAESKFHTVLSAAAISVVPKHACILMSEEGFPMRHECYTHIEEEEPAES